MPRRLRVSAGKEPPHGAIRVDSSTGYRNPFVVGEWPGLAFADYMAGAHVVRDQAHSVALFRALLVANLVKHDHTVDALLALRGHDLCCTCKLTEPCHADVLLELANVVAAEPPQRPLLH